MSDPSDEIERTVTLPPMKSITWTSIFSRTVLVGLLLIETLGLATAMLFLFHRVHPTTCTTGLDPNQLLYSPALVAVENEVRVYNIGFPGDLSSFQIPSSPALDQMWSDLYNFGISRISKDEAARLPNKTHAIPGDEGYYIAELDVFHNLHCLNKVRMALDPDYYPEWRISTTNNWIPSQKNATEHVSHCLDWIRQSIMCAGDTSVIVWQWEDSANASIVKGDVAHTCRNFDRLRDWGHEHTLHVEYDPAVHIEDDIAVPTFRSGGEQQRG
ncbi:hypothetical protein B0H15DRAFT_945726 [Mycena belliarum]|uniref:Tat pathway signal sequence n=1 Tax=Mycena belliarum TaxID=1033014 RepID=A0AAD6UAD5_9AGAR|nr:hypothetical protein B0H15DRAFT_945726 [Mycena belliae]